MQKLKQNENTFFKLLDTNDSTAFIALEKLKERFSDEDLLYGTTKACIINAIYINRYDDRTLWQIALAFHISDRTLYRYRHCFIEWLDFYYEKYSNQSFPAA